MNLRLKHHTIPQMCVKKRITSHYSLLTPALGSQSPGPDPITDVCIPLRTRGAGPVATSGGEAQPRECQQINKSSHFSSKTLLASSHPAVLYSVGLTPFLRAGVQVTYI